MSGESSNVKRSPSPVLRSRGEAGRSGKIERPSVSDQTLHHGQTACRSGSSAERQGMSMRTNPGTDAGLSNLLRKCRDSELAKRGARMLSDVRAKGQQSSPPPVPLGSWTKAEIKLLGTTPDRVVAKMLGRAVDAVRWERLARNIPCPIGARPWTPEEDWLLGSRSDNEIARLLGRTPGAVRARREKRRIPIAIPLRRPWVRGEEKLLGTRPDKEIAQLLKRHITTVGDRRRQLGIPHFVGNRREWKLEEERLLGTMPDQELARRLGRTLFSIRSKRLREDKQFYHWWTTTEEKLLGGMPDQEVAKRTGRTVRGVQLKRQRERILHPAPGRRKWTRKEERFLGAWLDEHVARMVGRSVSAVTARRRQLHIPQCQGAVAKSVPSHTARSSALLSAQRSARPDWVACQ